MYHGMITIYKEAGYTSSDVVARLRGILHMKKIGHTGTLDPDAEGVLPVCLGNATKLCDLIADRDKEYEAVLRLGVMTDTQDMSGRILEEHSQEEILEVFGGKDSEAVRVRMENALAPFVGEIEQIPPMYSAVKVNGKRLYELARQGKIIERKPRKITVYEIELEEIALPLIKMRVRCSKGTYIRTLCEDIGRSLGVGGAMEHLLRTRVGVFTLQEAIRLDDAEHIMKTEPDKILPHIMPVDGFFADAPKVAVKPEAMRYLLNGNTVRTSQVSCMDEQIELEDGYVRMYDEKGVFYALYECDARKKELKNVKMFLPENRK